MASPSHQWEHSAAFCNPGKRMQSIATVPQTLEWKARLLRLASTHVLPHLILKTMMLFARIGDPTPYVGGAVVHHEVRENISKTRCSTVLNKRAGYKTSENRTTKDQQKNPLLSSSSYTYLHITHNACRLHYFHGPLRLGGKLPVSRDATTPLMYTFPG